MGVLNEIRAALETQLATVSPSWPVAYENVNFSKPSDGKYLISHILPAKTFAYFGTQSFTKYQGLFNVQVVIPTDDGAANAETQAGLILSAFTRGLSLVSGTTTVRIDQPYTGKAQIEENEYCLPVWIPWFCHV